MIRTRGRVATYGEVWFDEKPSPPLPDILRYRQCAAVPDSAPRTPFLSLATELSGPEDELFARIAKGTRYEIRRADGKDNLDRRMLFAPSTSDIAMFAAFYDEFAASKSLQRIDRQWLAAALPENRLCLTICESGGHPVVWHSYVRTSTIARLLHSTSHARDKSADERALIGRANRWLHWQDICEFKRRGFTVYDWGGVFADEMQDDHRYINRFKRDFGGVERSSFNAIEPLTLRGKMWLSLRRIGETWPAFIARLRVR